MRCVLLLRPDVGRLRNRVCRDKAHIQHDTGDQVGLSTECRPRCCIFLNSRFSPYKLAIDRASPGSHALARPRFREPGECHSAKHLSIEAVTKKLFQCAHTVASILTSPKKCSPLSVPPPPASSLDPPLPVDEPTPMLPTTLSS
jgi:hypothetical protein